MLTLLPDGLVYALAAAGLALVTVALAFGLAAYLLHFYRRRSRPTPLPDATPPPVEAPPPSRAATPVRQALPSEPLLGASHWGGAYDDAATEDEPLKVPGHVVRPPAPRRYDPNAGTVPMRPRVGPWGGAPGPASTLSTTPEGVADQLEATGGDEGKAEAKRLRESAGARPIKVPTEFRGRVPHRDDISKPKGNK